MYIYVENVKDPSVRFQVVSYDKDTKQGKLKGEFGSEFTRDLSKPALDRYGYKLIRSEQELPLVSAPVPKAKKPKAAPVEDDEE